MAGIFKAYDIRGIYPSELDEALAERIGRAFAMHAGSREVAVGRDCRLSSPTLAAALMQGIRAQGADVIDLGLCSTPALYLAARTHDAIMISASHNPPQYNGFKLCKAGGIPVAGGCGMEELERLALQGTFPAAAPGGYRKEEILPEYVRTVRSFLDLKRPLKVVVDCAYAMGALTFPPVLEASGCTVSWLYDALDGRFPAHEPDPLRAENTRELQEAVVREGADIGIAFDGDCDRVFFIDEKGRRLESDRTMALFARHYLAREPGAKVLYAVNCSKVAREEIIKAGGVPLPTRIGHAPAKNAMRAQGAIFGGEISGHYYHRDYNCCDSGELTAAMMLSILSASGKPLSAMLDPLLRYAKSPELNYKVKDIRAAMDAVTAAFPGESSHRIDGYTGEYRDWWYNVRPSNTEPLLRLNIEADTPALLDARTRELGDIIRAFAP